MGGVGQESLLAALWRTPLLGTESVALVADCVDLNLLVANRVESRIHVADCFELDLHVSNVVGEESLSFTALTRILFLRSKWTMSPCCCCVSAKTRILPLLIATTSLPSEDYTGTRSSWFLLTALSKILPLRMESTKVLVAYYVSVDHSALLINGNSKGKAGRLQGHSQQLFFLPTDLSMILLLRTETTESACR